MKNKQTKAKRIVGLVCLFLFSFMAFVFGCVIVGDASEGVVVAYRGWLVAAMVLVTLLLLVLGCVFCFLGNNSLFRVTISVAFLFAFLLAVYCLLLKTGFLTIIHDPVRYEEFLRSAGGWIALVYVLLQYLQVIVLPIPSVVSTLAGVALFGAHLATLLSLLGVLAGSFTAFAIGRKLGGKAVAWMVGEETLSKWQDKVKGKDHIILSAMFLLPLFPDDVLCFVAGLSSMSNKFFAGMITVCRVIGIASTCYLVEFLPFTTWWGLLCWGSIYLTLMVVFVLFYRNLDKINAWLNAHKK